MCSCSGSCNCNSTTIPKGPQGSVGPIGGVGPAGPPNILTIGNVDEGPADATITGTSPNQILNLVIPQGPAGATGPNGTTRLHYLAGSASGSTLTPSWQNIDFYQLPANTLVNNGDSIIISTLHLQNNDPDLTIIFATTKPIPAYRRIRFNGVSLTVDSARELPDNTRSTIYLFRTTVELIKTGLNTATCKILADIAITNGVKNLETITYSTTITGLNFTTTNDIEFDVLQNFANQSVLKVLTIDLIKKV
jgi:hypothetical protein